MENPTPSIDGLNCPVQSGVNTRQTSTIISRPLMPHRRRSYEMYDGEEETRGELGLSSPAWQTDRPPQRRLSIFKRQAARVGRPTDQKERRCPAADNRDVFVLQTILASAVFLFNSLSVTSSGPWGVYTPWTHYTQIPLQCRTPTILSALKYCPLKTRNMHPRKKLYALSGVINGRIA